MSKPHIRRVRDGQSSAFIEWLISRRTALGLLGATAVAQVAGCGRASSTPPTPAATADAVHYLTLVDIGRSIASRDVSPVDLTEHMLDRIGRFDPALKSYATVTSEVAREAARAAEREIAAGKYRGPLHGVPIAVKDLCFTKGIRTMGGTAVRKDFVPDVDATVVSKLRDAGAVLLGKLNCPRVRPPATTRHSTCRSIRGIRIDGRACRRVDPGSRPQLGCVTPPSVRTQEVRFETRRPPTAWLVSSRRTAV